MSTLLGYLAILAGLAFLATLIHYSEQRDLQRYISTRPPPKPEDPYAALRRKLRQLDYEDDYVHQASYLPFDKATYLLSTQWQTIRKLVLKRDHYTCRSCSATNLPLEVHHLHYQNLGDEPLEDLVSLCRDCHQSIHDLYGYDQRDTFPI